MAAIPDNAKAVFSQMGELLKGAPEVVGQTKSIFQFDLKNGDAVTSYTIDLKNGAGAVYQGKVKEGKPTCTFALSEENFLKMLKKTANPQQLFMQGALKLTGDMGAAMKFDGVLKNLEKAGKAKL